MADCRFDFPQPLSEDTWLKSHDDPGNKSRFYVLKRSAGEENCNPYYTHLLKAWKANMDVQLIGSVYGTAAYVCSYMCKSESEEVRKVIRDASESLPPQASTRKRLSKIGNTMQTHHELSAQEAAYRLCHLPLKENSRKVVFLTLPHQKRERGYARVGLNCLNWRMIPLIFLPLVSLIDLPLDLTHQNLQA